MGEYGYCGDNTKTTIGLLKTHIKYSSHCPINLYHVNKNSTWSSAKQISILGTISFIFHVSFSKKSKLDLKKYKDIKKHNLGLMEETHLLIHKTQVFFYGDKIRFLS